MPDLEHAHALKYVRDHASNTEHRMRLIPIENSPESNENLKTIAPGDEIVSQVVDATLSLYQRKGCVPPWTGYLAFEDSRCVGTCGFAGPPSECEVEIAYFTFPGNEGRGIATRMARELIKQTKVLAEAEGYRYIAHTLPRDGPSTTILRKLGFTMSDEINHPEDGLVWKWTEAKPTTNESNT